MTRSICLTICLAPAVLWLSACESGGAAKALSSKTASKTSTPEAPAAKRSMPAPDFTLKDIHGSAVQLSSLRGKGVVLAFWFLGCPPCRAEAPHLSQVAERYRDKGVVVLSVDVQDADTPEQVKPFAEKLGLKHVLLMDGGIVGEKYGVRSTPTTFLINAQGEVFEGWIGADKERLEQGAQKLAAK